MGQAIGGLYPSQIGHFSFPVTSRLMRSGGPIPRRSFRTIDLRFPRQCRLLGLDLMTVEHAQNAQPPLDLFSQVAKDRISGQDGASLKLRGPIPIGSMVLVYMLTFGVY